MSKKLSKARETYRIYVNNEIYNKLNSLAKKHKCNKFDIINKALMLYEKHDLDNHPASKTFYEMFQAILSGNLELAKSIKDMHNDQTSFFKAFVDDLRKMK